MEGKRSLYPWLISLILNLLFFALGSSCLKFSSGAPVVPQPPIEVQLTSYTPLPPPKEKKVVVKKSWPKPILNNSLSKKIVTPKAVKVQAVSKRVITHQPVHSEVKKTKGSTSKISSLSSGVDNIKNNNTQDNNVKGNNPGKGAEKPVEEKPSIEKKVPEIATVGEKGVVNPDYIYTVQPSYPLEARKEGLEGRVILKVLVEKSGETGSVNIAKSSGHSVLDQEALKAVAKWRFRPAKKDGETIACWVFIPLSFKLQ